MPPGSVQLVEVQHHSVADGDAVLCIVAGGVADERNRDLAAGCGRRRRSWCPQRCLGARCLRCCRCWGLVSVALVAAACHSSSSSMTTASTRQRSFIMFFIISFTSLCEIFFRLYAVQHDNQVYNEPGCCPNKSGPAKSRSRFEPSDPGPRPSHELRANTHPASSLLVCHIQAGSIMRTDKYKNYKRQQALTSTVRCITTARTSTTKMDTAQNGSVHGRYHGMRMQLPTGASKQAGAHASGIGTSFD